MVSRFVTGCLKWADANPSNSVDWQQPQLQMGRGKRGWFCVRCLHKCSFLCLHACSTLAWPGWFPRGRGLAPDCRRGFGVPCLKSLHQTDSRLQFKDFLNSLDDTCICIYNLTYFPMRSFFLTPTFKHTAILKWITSFSWGWPLHISFSALQVKTTVWTWWERITSAEVDFISSVPPFPLVPMFDIPFSSNSICFPNNIVIFPLLYLCM